MNNSKFLGSAYIDNGYNGHKIWVYYVSSKDTVYEIHPNGFHNIPVVSAMSRLVALGVSACIKDFQACIDGEPV